MKIQKGLTTLCGLAGVGKTRFLIDQVVKKVPTKYFSLELSDAQKSVICNDTGGFACDEAMRLCGSIRSIER